MTNMTEQIISKETAILAKEKGFDWKVKAYYSSDRLWTDSNTPLIDYNNTNNVIYEKIFISVPTQALLQKWLRDVHNIHLHLCKVNSNWVCDIIQITEYGLGNHLVNPQTIFETTYEQALEKGLSYALEYLKLTNNNDIQ